MIQLPGELNSKIEPYRPLLKEALARIEAQYPGENNQYLIGAGEWLIPLEVWYRESDSGEPKVAVLKPITRAAYEQVYREAQEIAEAGEYDWAWFPLEELEKGGRDSDYCYHKIYVQSGRIFTDFEVIEIEERYYDKNI